MYNVKQKVSSNKVEDTINPCSLNIRGKEIFLQDMYKNNLNVLFYNYF